MVLRKKLVRHGNSYALILDKPILDMLGVGVGEEVEIFLFGRELLITSELGMTHEEALAAFERVKARHDETFRKLAD